MSDLFAGLLDNPIVGTIGSALLIALVALWLAAAWWAYRDAGRRTESPLAALVAAGWIVVSSPLLLPLALAVYGFVRPSVTAAEQRAQSLVTALSAGVAAGATCPTCGAAAQHDWRRCPQCATWLSAACSACGQWAPAGLELCPFCGREAPEPDEDALPLEHDAAAAARTVRAKPLVAASRGPA